MCCYVRPPDLGRNVTCPHCQNDDETLISFVKLRHYPDKTVRVFVCEVCSKQFECN